MTSFPAKLKFSTGGCRHPPTHVLNFNSTGKVTATCCLSDCGAGGPQACSLLFAVSCVNPVLHFTQATSMAVTRFLLQGSYLLATRRSLFCSTCVSKHCGNSLRTVFALSHWLLGSFCASIAAAPSSTQYALRIRSTLVCTCTSW
jgi:hypothetical protein